jgi:hypothetical protein
VKVVGVRFRAPLQQAIACIPATLLPLVIELQL